MRNCFEGLTHVYGTYDPQTGRAWQVKRQVTDGVVLDHIQGRQPYGVYLLVGDRIRAMAVDFDEDDLSPPMEFLRATRQYGIIAYLERSKVKGYHSWLCFERGGVLAARARIVIHHILAEIGRPHTEVFPKQDWLRGDGCYGNFINVPLFGRLIGQGRTVFLDPSNPTQPFADQWELLAHVHRVSAEVLDKIIEINDLGLPTSGIATSCPPSSSARALPSFGLPPCAQRMLADGVVDNQRVACFRLALHLKKSGLPLDLAIAALSAWALKNRPRNGKRIITGQEVADQARSAYGRSYRGCGCDEPAIRSYCDPACPVRTGRGLGSGTSGVQAPPRPPQQASS